ncbi:MAG: transcriptional repressor [Clostridia bacterium]|nr:transcriptional repressor [Clostridia bacterium]
MKQEYNTKQKEYILEYLRANAQTHVSVGDILAHLHAHGREVGTTTVYRYLDRLCRSGEVRKYVIDETSGACYQYIADTDECEKHFHLKCTRCGRLIHVDCAYLGEVGRHIGEHHRFTVDSSKTVFYGVCEACAEK